MSIQNLRYVFENSVLPFGDALTGIYANGGLMAYHDGVNAAVEAFWSAAEQAAFSGLSTQDRHEINDVMYPQIAHLACNASTSLKDIVGHQRYAALLREL